MTETNYASLIYVPVKCAVCGWEHGLRSDMVAAGNMNIWCDPCDRWQISEVFTPIEELPEVPPSWLPSSISTECKRLATGIITYTEGEKSHCRQWSIRCMPWETSQDMKSHLARWKPTAQFVSAEIIPDQWENNPPNYFSANASKKQKS